ncbi:MAG: pseudaminic acid synthase [Thermococcaceae archaeon]|jgi:pseudaminic acid synthase|nr:pseudaminic acid synthase [Thermococcaceae archaeon]
MKAPYIKINDRKIGPGYPVYIVAELSANHNQDFETAVKLIEAAKEAGADAVKVQTYTPDTITIDVDRPEFKIKGGTLWDGKTLYELYKEAYMPWEWQKELKKIANKLGLDFFSAPFDPTAVNFLEKLGVPAYKIASPEIVDIPLIEKVAETGKPVIISTGMANLCEIEEAVQAVRKKGNYQIALLKCTSAYPAPYESMNLKTIPNMMEAFGVPVGLSDHTLGIEVPIAAVALGASIIEKHFTLSRSIQTPDSAFSLEPHEFKAMVQAIRNVEKALGDVRYGTDKSEEEIKKYRRSLYVVRDIKKGELFTEENVKSIRPGYGLPPKYLKEILGRKARCDIPKGTPLRWEFVE